MLHIYPLSLSEQANQSYQRDNSNKKKALIIAVSDYDHLPQSRQLPFCKNDAQALCEVLGIQGYEIPKVRKLIGRVEYETMRTAIREFFREGVKPKDTLLFYFSGHGYLDPPDHYLVTSEMDFKRPDDKGYLFEDLTRLINRSHSERIVSILDCCHSGGLELEGKGGEEDEEKTAEQSKQSMSKSIDQEINQAQGRCILASSLGLQQSFKMPGEEYSAFSYFLIGGLKGGNGQAVNYKGHVTPELLASYVNNELFNLPEAKKQTPIRKMEIVGEISLAYYPDLAKRREQQTSEKEHLLQLLREGKVEEFNNDTLSKETTGEIEHGWQADERLALPNPFQHRLDLYGTRIPKANLPGIDLHEADICHGILSRSVLSGAIFNRANLAATQLDNTNLRESHLEKAYLSQANLSYADLSGAILSQALLLEVDLYRAKLSGADLSNAVIVGCKNYDKLECDDANFNGAIIDKEDLVKYLDEHGAKIEPFRIVTKEDLISELQVKGYKGKEFEKILERSVFKLR